MTRAGRAKQGGFTLLETVFAAVILVITVAGVMALFGATFKMNRWQGDPSTRTVEYAQDKMESLLALTFGDATTDTTVWPYCGPPNCVPLTANPTGLAPGGGHNGPNGGTYPSPPDPSNPVAGYVDWLDGSGNLQSVNTGAAYIRVWSIVLDPSDATNNLKRITVVAQSLDKTTFQVQTTLVCLKSNQQ